MVIANIQVSETPLVLYTLRRADDALILGHRLSEWCGHAPMLEEDMALANMGLDLLGQARELYGYAARVEGKGHDEDKFAYLRDVRQYRNLLLVEQGRLFLLHNPLVLSLEVWPDVAQDRGRESLRPAVLHQA